MNRHKVFGMISLSAKAGKMGSGEFTVEKAVKSKKARLVLVAGDASANTRNRFQNMCAYYQVPCYLFATKEQLGRAVGKEFRASLVCLDENLAKAIIGQLEVMNED